MSETSVKKGFGMTIGAMFALFVVFVILPFGACVGCTVCAGAGAGMQEAKKAEEVQKLGPEVEISDLLFKVDDSNKFLHKLNYKFTVKNNRDRNLVKGFDVKFVDKDGLQVETDLIFGETINAGASREFTGSTISQPEASVNIASMEVEVR